MITRILLPLDGSDVAQLALQSACSLAKTHKASIIVFGCLALDDLVSSGLEMSPITFDSIWTERKDQLLEHLQKGVEELREAGLTADLTWSSGRPTERIVEAANEHDCNCIVMTSHGRSGFRRWVMGSVTEGVLRKATCPVLVIPCDQS